MKTCSILSLLVLLFCLEAKAQADIYFAGAVKSRRDDVHRNIVRNIINRNLALPVNDSTSEDWISALDAIQVLNYRSPWVNARIAEALHSGKGTRHFKKSLVETIFALYPDFTTQVYNRLDEESDPVVFAAMAEYVIQYDSSRRNMVLQKANARLKDSLTGHLSLLIERNTPATKVDVAEIFSKRFLPGEVLVISMQRKDRRYPGLAIVRDTSGNYVRDSNGLIFSVSQLGRSVNNLPYYFKGGNTPQGLYKMNGFDISRSEFIGPTPNLQMLMPFETSARVFLKDSLAPDTLTMEAYGNLLPPAIRSNHQFYESWNAGRIGRNEIIAHGTTVNPDYYKNEIFYPLTPTSGCLSTIELWDTTNGKRKRSDQVRLIEAITRAGGPTGYVFVIELDDTHSPVLLGDVLHLIPG